MLVPMVAVASVTAMALIGAPERAAAAVLVTIDKSTQQMTVEVDGETRHVFQVSTGRSGFGTPSGQFRPQRLARKWFSRKYYNSPMPHSIFFHGGYAIHGSYEISRLGGPASHGCVRLHPANAATLFALVSGQGAGNTRIVVTGSNPVHARQRLLVRTSRLPDAEPERSVRKPVHRGRIEPVRVSPRMADRRALARPARRGPDRRAPIYQDPATGVLWIYSGSSVRILSR